MTTPLNIRHNLYRSPTAIADPGDAKTITIDRDGGICSVVTAAAETRALRQPTKAGIVGSICLDTDGGDLTLTVTGGYNADGDTSITLADAGDFVRFLSIKVGTSYYWRVVAHEGTNVAEEDLTVDTLTATTGTITTATVATLAHAAADLAEHGDGALGAGGSISTNRYTRDGTIITEILIDLTGLDSSGVANDVIGTKTPGTDAAYIGRNVVGTNGVIYKVEMSCLEVPLTGDADILLVQGSAADETFDDTVADTVTLCDGTGDWALGETIVNIAPAVTANYYYYLTQGGADDATYTAGQFIIRFYGHAALA